MSRLLFLGGLLDLNDGETCKNRGSNRLGSRIKSSGWFLRTRRKRLLELLCLLGVVKSQGVEVTRAANLELCLDLAASYPGGNLLDACLC